MRRGSRCLVAMTWCLFVSTPADAAKALPQAPEAQPKWAHPSYWAGWVLWGLPD